MDNSSQELKIAAYMVWHGADRMTPRLTELQWLRIQRYVNLLRKAESRFRGPLRPYMDIGENHDQTTDAEEINKENYPGFAALVHDCEAGNIQVVFLDLDERAFYSRYRPGNLSLLLKVLNKTGVQILNVFEDPDQVLERAIKKDYGVHANIKEVNDASDYACFFPDSAGEIARAKLRRYFQGPLKGTDHNRVYEATHSLERFPYSRGHWPFIQPELAYTWIDASYAEEKQVEEAKRLHQQVYRLGPATPERVAGPSRTRSQHDSAWAEARVLTLGFEKIVDGLCVQYVRDHKDYRIFADVNSFDSMTFYLYRLPQEENSDTESSVRFFLADRFTQEIGKRWEREFDAAIERRSGHVISSMLEKIGAR